MAIESEIKFTVPDKSIFQQIVSLKKIAGFSTVDRGINRHTDIYFDTPDFRLYSGKIVFRLRTAESGSVLALKAQGQSGNGIFRRIEIEAETDVEADDIVSGHLPDIPPARELYDRVGKVDLVQSLRVTNNRRTILLERDGEQCFELVLDDVTFYGSKGKKSILELEVESKIGSDESLKEIGVWLGERFNLEKAGPSKYIRGMKLAGGLD